MKEICLFSLQRFFSRYLPVFLVLMTYCVLSHEVTIGVSDCIFQLELFFNVHQQNHSLNTDILEETMLQNIRSITSQNAHSSRIESYILSPIIFGRVCKFSTPYIPFEFFQWDTKCRLSSKISSNLIVLLSQTKQRLVNIFLLEQEVQPQALK